METHRRSKTLFHCYDCGFTNVTINDCSSVADCSESIIHKIPNSNIECTKKGDQIFKNIKVNGSNNSFVFYTFVYGNEFDKYSHLE
jgi:hypothetical protein